MLWIKINKKIQSNRFPYASKSICFQATPELIAAADTVVDSQAQTRGKLLHETGSYFFTDRFIF